MIKSGVVVGVFFSNSAPTPAKVNTLQKDEGVALSILLLWNLPSLVSTHFEGSEHISGVGCC